MKYAGMIRHLRLVRPQPNAAVEQVAKQFASLDPAVVFRAGFKLDARAQAPPAGLLKIGATILQVPGPFNAPVLARHGSRLTLATEQDGPAWSDADWAVTLGPVLLRDGVLAEREWRNPAVQIQPDARRPRVAVGWRDSMVLVYHGVATIPEVAQWFQGRVDHAIACDGGSGTQWWYRGTVGRLDDGVAILPSAFILRGEVEPLDASQPVRVMLDPGHTGASDPGAVAGGLREADITLDIAQHAAAFLTETPGVTVRLTRTEARDLASPYTAAADLRARAAMANAWPADLFVSIHCNSAQDPKAEGLETYTHPAASDRARAIAQVVHRHLAPLFRVDRGLKAANFAVLRETQMPAVLVELGFLTNAHDQRNLAMLDFRAVAGQHLAAAVREIFGRPNPYEPEIQRLRADNAALTARVATLEARLAKIRAALEE